MNLVCSSGGVGDALIVALKILKRFPDNSGVSWRHFEKHECHLAALNSISKFMGRYIESCQALIDKHPYTSALEMCGLPMIYPPEDVSIANMHYLSSSCARIVGPYLPNSFVAQVNHDSKVKDSFGICVQKQAGRMHDSTRREIGLDVIDQLLRLFPDETIAVVGPLPSEIPNIPRVINLTGKMPDLVDVLALINRCKMFVGQDGVLSYYAMMVRKPAVVNYHDSRLLNNYWNEEWGFHSLPVTLGHDLTKLPNPLLPKIKALMG